MQAALGLFKGDNINQSKEGTEHSLKEEHTKTHYITINKETSGSNLKFISVKENIPKQENTIVEANNSSAYMRRNVYKAIIRRMLSYIRGNKVEVLENLRSNGFELSSIEDAFHKVKSFNDLEKEKGNPKQSQVILKKIVEKRTPCTYILKETLRKMIEEWQNGKLGRISKDNLRIYKEVSAYYYDLTVQALNSSLSI